MRCRIEGLVAEGGFEHEAILGKILRHQGRPIGPIPQQGACAWRYDLGQERQIRLVSAGQTHGLDPAGTVAADMEAKAGAGLAGGMVPPVAGRVTDAAAPPRTAKAQTGIGRLSTRQTGRPSGPAQTNWRQNCSLNATASRPSG